MSTVSGPECYRQALGILRAADAAQPDPDVAAVAVAVAQVYATLAQVAATMELVGATVNGQVSAGWGEVL